ncbi:MAG TPA: hypothetical protein VF491_15960 [Vicinamibacterales bacterium]
MLFVALLLETGLLLILIPWSAFWERNYFVEGSVALAGVLTSNYTRGAITGLGLVNVWSALGELSDLFGTRNPQSPDLPSPIDPQSEIQTPK